MAKTGLAKEDRGEGGEGGSRKMHSEGCDGLEWGSC